MSQVGPTASAEAESDLHRIAWCARADVDDGVDGDPPLVAMRGWRDAAREASRQVGTDPLLLALERLGLPRAARLYGAAREGARRASSCANGALMATGLSAAVAAWERGGEATSRGALGVKGP
jgi:hypothetical protein